MQNPVAAGGEGGVVGDDDEGASVFTDKVEEEFDDGLAGLGVEIAGRFVSEENAGIVDEGAGDGDALLFAATEFGGEVVQAVLESHAFEEVGGGGGCVALVDHGWNEDVFEGREFGKQEVGLENEAHALIAQAGKAVGADGVEVLFLKMDGACFRAFEAGEGVEEGGFSGSGGTAEKNGLAFFDLHADSAEHGDGGASDAKGALEVFGAQVR